MVTFKQAMRTGGRIARSIEREQKRQNREALRVLKQLEKEEALANAEKAVNTYNSYIDSLMSIHKGVFDEINWEEVVNEVAPIPVEKRNTNEAVIIKIIENYKPSFWDKLFFLEERKKNQLQVRLAQARLIDQSEFEKSKNKYETDVAEWNLRQDIAKRILQNDLDARREALDHLQTFSTEDFLGASVKVQFYEKHIDVELLVSSTEVVPDYILSLTKTGKLSQRDMPKSKFNELYQDYICGCVYRIGKEIFSIFPFIDKVVVTAKSELLNTTNGFLEESPILSVLLAKDTMSKMNFDRIDQSDSLSNFIHNMSFSKLNGFNKVDKLSI